MDIDDEDRERPKKTKEANRDNAARNKPFWEEFRKDVDPVEYMNGHPVIFTRASKMNSVGILPMPTCKNRDRIKIGGENELQELRRQKHGETMEYATAKVDSIFVLDSASESALGSATELHAESEPDSKPEDKSHVNWIERMRCAKALVKNGPRTRQINAWRTTWPQSKDSKITALNIILNLLQGFPQALNLSVLHVCIN